MSDNEKIIDWFPEPGYLLCKTLKRDEVAKLYKRPGGTNLALPSGVGKISDSVGVGEVVLCGKQGLSLDQELKIKELIDNGKLTKAEAANWSKFNFKDVKPGDLVAFMPYTDLIIEIDGSQYSLLEYEKIRAIRRPELAEDAKKEGVK